MFVAKTRNDTVYMCKRGSPNQQMTIADNNVLNNGIFYELGSVFRTLKQCLEIPSQQMTRLLDH